MAGISKQTFYNWLKRAEAGNEQAIAFVDALEKAEGQAEAQIVRNVKKASELPQFWAAGMTLLERKSPDRWGRRQDDSSVPRVVVQIGVKDSDVTVNVTQPALSPVSHNDLAQLSTGQVMHEGLIIGDYVNQRESVPAAVSPTSTTLAAPDQPGDPTGEGMARSGVRGAETGKGARRGGRKKKA